MEKINKHQKVFSFLLAVAFVVTVSTVSSVASAQSVLSAVFPDTFLKNGKIDIGSFIGLVFQVVLYAALLWTVWNVVLAGIGIAGAKEDGEKRKKGIQAVINAVIGLVVALLAFGIVNTVTGLLGANIDNLEVTTTPCIGTDNSTRISFSGFLTRDGRECVLKDSSGREIRRGPVISDTNR